MTSIFLQIYQLLKRRSWLLVIILMMIGLFSALSIRKVQLIEDITDVLPKSGGIQEVSQILNESELSKRIVFNLISNKAEKNVYEHIELADALTDTLLSLQEQYAFELNYVQEEIDLTSLFDYYYENLPYFMTDGDYQYLDSILKQEKLDEVFADNRARLITPEGIGLRQFILKDPLHIVTRPLQRLQKINIDDRYELVDGRIVSNDPLNLVFFINPSLEESKTQMNAEFFDEIDLIVKHFSTAHSDIECLYFSGSRVAVGNATQVKKDVYLTVAIAIVMLLLLIGTYLRKPWSVIKLFVPLILAGITALALLVVFRPNISIIAIGVGSILLGISIDYAVHFYVHYRNHGDVLSSIKALTPSILMSSITTAIAFLCLSIIESSAIADLAVFAAFAIVSSAIYTLVILPLIFKDHNQKPSGNHIIDRLASIPTEKWRWSILGSILLIILCIPYARKVQFNEDLMDLNYMSEELRLTEKRLNELNSFSQKSMFLVSSGKDQNEAINSYERAKDQLEKLKSAELISDYNDHTALVSPISERANRLEKWKSYWDGKQEIYGQMIAEAAKASGFNEKAYQYAVNMIYEPYDMVNEEAIEDFKDQLLRPYLVQTGETWRLLTLVKTDPEKRDALLNAFVYDDDNLLLDKQYITARFVNLLRNGFEDFVNFSLIAVFIVLWLFYGRIELAVVTFLPILSAWIVTLAFMSFFNITFNIFNIMLASFVFGLGIDYCIFISRAFQRKYETGEDNIQTYRASIYLSAFTTIIGTGVLIFAKHPAIHSLAFIAIFGISSVLFFANSLQPFLFNFLVYRKGNVHRSQPITLIVLYNTLIVYGLFVTGVIFMYLLRLLLLITPLPKKNKKWIFHLFIKWLNKLVLNSVFHIPREHIDEHHFKGHEPAVVIANHQSFVDILFGLNYQVKMLLQTKDWVWNNVLLKPIVRFADCYPISFGYDQNLELVKNSMKDGYSFLIYPEGSRSEDQEIKRFHKGAFFMAQELKADIQPILYLGAGNVMPKKAPFLYSVKLYIKFLPRIAHDSPEYGLSYQERNKNIVKYMRKEYDQMKQDYLTPKYFRNKMISRYIYKGPVLEWYCRIKTRLEKNYDVFNQYLPKSGLIYDVGCGYGFLSHLLMYTSQHRQLIGVDYDSEKIEVANHAEHEDHRPQFIQGDVCTFDFGKAEAFVIADVMHYLTKANQEKLLRKCLEQLKPGGTLMLRDANAGIEKRHIGTKITELFSTRIFGFNQTANELEFVDDSFFLNIFKEYDVTVEKIDNTKLTSNQIFIARKNG